MSCWPLLTLLGGLLAAPAAEPLDGELREVSWVGFRHTAKHSRVWVTTTDPVHYSLDTADPSRVVLTLDNAKVPLANTARDLPTQFFKGPVTRVSIYNVEGASPSVRIEVHTRRHPRLRHHQNDNLLALDFLPLSH